MKILLAFFAISSGLVGVILKLAIINRLEAESATNQISDDFTTYETSRFLMEISQFDYAFLILAAIFATASILIKK